MSAVTPLLWTAGDFERAGAAGVIPAHAELIEGVIYRMSPQNPAHAAVVSYLTRKAFAAVGGSGLVVRIQLPVRLNTRTEPEPDLCIARGPESRYLEAHPGPEDVHLIVEASDTTLAYDTGLKLQAYTAAGIGEVWIIDIPGRLVHRHQPRTGSEATEVATSMHHEATGLTVSLREIFGN